MNTQASLRVYDHNNNLVSSVYHMGNVYVPTVNRVDFICYGVLHRL